MPLRVLCHIALTATLVVIGSCLVRAVLLPADEMAPMRRVDPAAWGGDHVGKASPQYVTGEECLFCHREIGKTWPDNRHQLTVRPADPTDPAIAMLRDLSDGEKLAAETKYLLGSNRITRFLKRSNEYGKLDLLATAYLPEVGELKDHDSPHWDTKSFADRCAGCHATAVEAQTRAFSAISLECYTCHGDVDLEHTKDISRVLLSSKNREPRATISLCGQCHLRGGKSRSTGLPYPNTFVAGDNLFRDFEVDLSDAATEALPAIEQHVFITVRDVAEFERSTMTCLTCHDVHGQSSKKHQQLEDANVCSTCHVPGTDNTKLRDAILPVNRHRTHNRVCDY